MADKVKIVIILAIIVILALMSLIQSCKVKALESEVDSYRRKTEILNDSLELVNEENQKLRAMMQKANTALEKMIEKAEGAKDEHQIRDEKIDSADPDWLMCPLPNDVREAFGAYCNGNAGIDTTCCITYAMQQAICRKA